MTIRSLKLKLHRMTHGAAAVALLAGMGAFGVPLAHAAAAATPVKTGMLSTYLVNSSGTVMCLHDYQDGLTNGTPVVVKACDPTKDAQQWTLYSDNTIRIHGKCLEVAGSKTANNSPIDIYTCNGTNTQNWTVGTNPTVSLNDLVGTHSGKCLDVTSAKTDDNSPVGIYTCDHNTQQVWGWNTGGTVVEGGSTVDANCHGSVVGGNTCYYWVGGVQNNNGSFTASGVTANFDQPNPAVSSSAGYGTLNHSITEMYAASADGQQAIELGWYKDSGDSSPILFATHWVNGVFEGYAENGGTGYVSTNSGFDVGDNVTVGTTGTYKIVYSSTSSQWQIWYNGTEVGYFPESLWTAQSTSFTQLGNIQVYGEVEVGVATVSDTNMGNGTLGSNSGATAVSNYALIGGSTASQLTGYYEPSGGATAYYDYGNTGTTGYTLGGPGY